MSDLKNTQNNKHTTYLFNKKIPSLKTQLKKEHTKFRSSKLMEKHIIDILNMIKVYKRGNTNNNQVTVY